MNPALRSHVPEFPGVFQFGYGATSPRKEQGPFPACLAGEQGMDVGAAIRNITAVPVLPLWGSWCLW